jgi:hypothetical protein
MTIPAGISGELVLDAREKVKLKELDGNQSRKHFELVGGTTVNLKLKYL